MAAKSKETHRYCVVSSLRIPYPITYGINGINPKIANDKNVTKPFHIGFESSTTNPNYYNIIIFTNALLFVANKSANLLYFIIYYLRCLFMAIIFICIYLHYLFFLIL